MKVSYEWLSEYVDLNGYTARDLAELLTRSGIEVDAMESLNKGVTSVVVGYVKQCVQHPDADRLRVCTVDAGIGEDLSIVCGAPNVAAGQKVPVALVGAKLPGGLAIKRAKLRGVESQGMICSAKELGLNDKLMSKEAQEGILRLPEDAEVGANVAVMLGIEDEVLELDLTPNRSDCLSMLGVAYEIAAILGREVKLPDAEAGLSGSAVKASDHIGVQITAKEQCEHYTARLIEGVSTGPSPQWMQNRLMAAGIRPISNIVDITNYVMLEYGQPLHAFDADTLAGGRIDVRLARAGETLVTLDGSERPLEPHMLLIDSGGKPVGLAGVMGGANSEVTDGTTRILLESAKFAGASVRRTSRQLGLRSEASLRFEKEVNPEAVIPALNRAASLMAMYAGGKVAEGVVEDGSDRVERATISISENKANQFLGTELSASDIGAIFARLGFDYSEESGAVFRVTVPARRGDITRDVDLYEEIARLHGYDNIPTTLITGATTPGALTAEQRIRRTIRAVLTGAGVHEAINYSLSDPEALGRIDGLHPGSRPITLAMPMSVERSVLRTSLVPHLLESAAYNQSRGTDDVAVFEIASVFVTEQERLTSLPEEKPVLALLMTGSRKSAHWSGDAGRVDFYDLKGVLESMTNHLGIERVVFVPSEANGYHPGRTADIMIETSESRDFLGRIGQIHPTVSTDFDLEETYALEIALDVIYRHVNANIVYGSLPRYPSVARDIAVVAAVDKQVGAMLDTIKLAAGPLLESVDVFDIYTGERVGEGEKSVAFSLVYRHAERTLTDEEIAELQAKVVEALEQNFDAQLRK